MEDWQRKLGENKLGKLLREETLKPFQLTSTLDTIQLSTESTRIICLDQLLLTPFKMNGYTDQLELENLDQSETLTPYITLKLETSGGMVIRVKKWLS